MVKRAEYPRNLYVIFLVIAGFGLVIPQSTFAGRARITGTAAYREREALPPEAVFEAKLLDVSRADAPAHVIGETRKVSPGQVPIAFEIEFESDRIDPGHSYAVRATIHVEGKLRFTSDQSYSVLTRGHGNTVSIVLKGVPGGGEETSPLGPLPVTFTGLLPCADCLGIRYQLNLLPQGAYFLQSTYLLDGHDSSYYEVGAWSMSGSTLVLAGGRKGNGYWSVKNPDTLRKLDNGGNPIDSTLPYELKRSAVLEPMVPRVRFSGMFRYMADAARFRDCRSGLEWPVATGDAYAAAERAYTSHRTEPGAELMMTIQARIESLPRMEGTGTEATLIVEEFVSATPGESCGGSPGLANNRWRPILIGDKVVQVDAQQKEPWIHLDPKKKRVTGSGGCNRINGSYEEGKGVLRFSQMISTRMACPSMETEAAFLRALQDTRRFRIRGRFLELMDGRGNLLVRLEERNL
jgi:uncharacterized lipoprotein YbaY/heat shock protein HslJ